MLPDGTSVPRLFLTFSGEPAQLEEQVLTLLAPGGASLTLVGDYTESIVVCGVAGGMLLHELSVTGFAPD